MWRRRFTEARYGALEAITAMAHKLARLVYRMLRWGREYVDKGLQYYEERVEPHHDDDEHVPPGQHRHARPLEDQRAAARVQRPVPLNAFTSNGRSTMRVVYGVFALVACYLPARRATKIDPLEGCRAL